MFQLLKLLTKEEWWMQRRQWRGTGMSEQAFFAELAAKFQHVVQKHFKLNWSASWTVVKDMTTALVSMKIPEIDPSELTLPPFYVELGYWHASIKRAIDTRDSKQKKAPSSSQVYAEKLKSSGQTPMSAFATNEWITADGVYGSLEDFSGKENSEVKKAPAAASSAASSKPKRVLSINPMEAAMGDIAKSMKKRADNEHEKILYSRLVERNRELQEEITKAVAAFDHDAAKEAKASLRQVQTKLDGLLGLDVY